MIAIRFRADPGASWWIMSSSLENADSVEVEPEIQQSPPECGTRAGGQRDGTRSRNTLRSRIHLSTPHAFHVRSTGESGGGCPSALVRGATDRLADRPAAILPPSVCMRAGARPRSSYAPHSHIRSLSIGSSSCIFATSDKYTFCQIGAREGIGPRYRKKPRENLGIPPVPDPLRRGIHVDG